MIDWPVEELLGKPQHAILHHSRPDGSPYPRDLCPIYAALQDGAVHNVEDEVFWRKDGTSFPVEYVSTPMIERGQVVGAVVVFRDISRRRAMERQLAENVESLEATQGELTTALDALLSTEDLALAGHRMGAAARELRAAVRKLGAGAPGDDGAPPGRSRALPQTPGDDGAPLGRSRALPQTPGDDGAPPGRSRALPQTPGDDGAPPGRSRALPQTPGSADAARDLAALETMLAALAYLSSEPAPAPAPELAVGAAVAAALGEATTAPAAGLVAVDPALRAAGSERDLRELVRLLVACVGGPALVRVGDDEGVPVVSVRGRRKPFVGADKLSYLFARRLAGRNLGALEVRHEADAHVTFLLRLAPPGQ